MDAHATFGRISSSLRSTRWQLCHRVIGFLNLICVFLIAIVRFPWEMRRYGPGYWPRSKVGNLDGFSASIELVPELGLGVTVLCNAADLDAHALTEPIVKLLLPALRRGIDLSIPAPQYAPIPVSQFVGQWIGVGSVLSVSPLDGATNYFPAILGDNVKGVLVPQHLDTVAKVFLFVFRVNFVGSSLSTVKRRLCV
jgi:hypothetical protein